MKERTYIAIDLKSFYASVECRERGLIRWTQTSSLRMRAVLTKQSALPLLPPSRATASQDADACLKYHGAIVKDHYGRQIPKHAHGTANLDGHTSSTKKIMCAVSELFDRIVDKNLLVRRLNIVANHVLPEADAPKKIGRAHV